MMKLNVASRDYLRKVIFWIYEDQVEKYNTEP